MGDESSGVITVQTRYIGRAVRDGRMVAEEAAVTRAQARTRAAAQD
jgi:hypothetical protein